MTRGRTRLVLLLRLVGPGAAMISASEGRMWSMVLFQWFLNFSAMLTALVVYERYFRRD